MEKKKKALILAKELKSSLSFGDSISNLLLGCQTVCRYMDISDKNMWIEYELNGYNHLENMQSNEIKKIIPNYRLASFKFYIRDNLPVIMNNIVAQRFSIQPVLAGVGEFENSIEFTILTSNFIDEYNNLFKPRYFVNKATLSFNSIIKIKNGIRSRINEFLDKVILELEFGEIPEQIFETIRNEVDSKMIEICPNVIDKLIVIYENLRNGNSESFSHVASSCRRIIKDVADVIFPAKNEPIIISGQKVKVDEKSYINRIHEGLKEKTKSKTTNEFNKDMLNYVMAFLRSINSYASMGDHSNFTKLDAIRCVIYTYLLLGDILYYYKINLQETNHP